MLSDSPLKQCSKLLSFVEFGTAQKMRELSHFVKTMARGLQDLTEESVARDGQFVRGTLFVLVPMCAQFVMQTSRPTCRTQHESKYFEPWSIRDATL